jgi:hypothetical protein
MSVLGIDLAAGTKKTFACLLSPADGGLRASVAASCDDQMLFELARGCKKVAIDAPFGWPSQFVDALNAHRAGRAWPAPDDGQPEVFRASLSFRATDRVVMHTRRPLSVSTDRLGVTAMRCALLLHRWSSKTPVDRTGRAKFVEVYPAAALIRWGLGGSGYKRSNHTALGTLLGALRKQLPELEMSDDDHRRCASSDDAFDALVAALVARASLLGLTDPPPTTHRETAAQEGWIHLPVRGSLPFLARNKSTIAVEPRVALARALSATGVKVTPHGYVKRFDDAVLKQFTEATKAAIRADLSGKGGSELSEKTGGPPKFHAAHSSAAMAANVFGPFLRERAGVPIGTERFTGQTHLEVECRSGLRGTPPTLDCLVDGPVVLAVESKCTEIFSPHVARFSDAYERAMASAHASWRAEYQRLAEDPARYRYLDAAQLLKHYLGLRQHFPSRPVTLAYLYWEPVNGHEIAPCCIHRAELAEFEKHVRDPKLRFISVSYRALWAEWAAGGQPAWLRKHAAALRRRYEIAV